MQQYLEIGQIVSVHGLKGEVKVQPWCDTPADFCKFKKLYSKNGEVTYKVERSREQGNMVILKLQGVDTVEQGQAMRNKILHVDRKDIKLPKGSYFVADLLTLEAFDEQGKSYGKLTDVIKTGANDVYELTKGEKKYYIPAIPSVILKTDIKNGQIIIYPMEGLFDED